MEQLNIEFVGNNFYNNLNDINIRRGKNLLRIIYGGNEDLYLSCFGDHLFTDDDKIVTKFTLDSNFEYFYLFEQLYNELLANPDLNNNEIINWYSDSTYDENANLLKIEKSEDTIELSFIESFNDPETGIRVSNSGSKYDSSNIPFMNLYNCFQQINKNQHTEKSSQVVQSEQTKTKNLVLNKK